MPKHPFLKELQRHLVANKAAFKKATKSMNRWGFQQIMDMLKEAKKKITVHRWIKGNTKLGGDPVWGGQSDVRTTVALLPVQTSQSKPGLFLSLWNELLELWRPLQGGDRKAEVQGTLHEASSWGEDGAGEGRPGQTRHYQETEGGSCQEERRTQERWGNLTRPVGRSTVNLWSQQSRMLIS